MSTDDVMRAVRELGGEFVLRPDGTPAIRSKAAVPAAVSEPMLRALRWHRDEIIRRLRQHEARPA